MDLSLILNGILTAQCSFNNGETLQNQSIDSFNNTLKSIIKEILNEKNNPLDVKDSKLKGYLQSPIWGGIKDLDMEDFCSSSYIYDQVFEQNKEILKVLTEESENGMNNSNLLDSLNECQNLLKRSLKNILIDKSFYEIPTHVDSQIKFNLRNISKEDCLRDVVAGLIFAEKAEEVKEIEKVAGKSYIFKSETFREGGYDPILKNVGQHDIQKSLLVNEFLKDLEGQLVNKDGSNIIDNAYSTKEVNTPNMDLMNGETSNKELKNILESRMQEGISLKDLTGYELDIQKENYIFKELTGIEYLRTFLETISKDLIEEIFTQKKNTFPIELNEFLKDNVHFKRVNNSVIRITVSEEVLGIFDIEVTIDKDLINARIVASEPAGKQFFDSNLSNMLEQLLKEGLNIGKFSVYLGRKRSNNIDNNTKENDETIKVINNLNSIITFKQHNLISIFV